MSPAHVAKTFAKIRKKKRAFMFLTFARPPPDPASSRWPTPAAAPAAVPAAAPAALPAAAPLPGATAAAAVGGGGSGLAGSFPPFLDLLPAAQPAAAAGAAGTEQVMALNRGQALPLAGAAAMAVIEVDDGGGGGGNRGRLWTAAEDAFPVPSAKEVLRPVDAAAPWPEAETAILLEVSLGLVVGGLRWHEGALV
jgi:hypothetical protein